MPSTTVEDLIDFAGDSRLLRVLAELKTGEVGNFIHFETRIAA